MQNGTFVLIITDDGGMEMNMKDENSLMTRIKKRSLQFIKTYPRVDPMISSACDEIISAIISSFMASLAFFHLRPPGKMIGRSCGCKPRKFFAFFCLIVRSSVTFCFNSADNSVLTSTGSCYSAVEFEMVLSHFFYYLIEEELRRR